MLQAGGGEMMEMPTGVAAWNPRVHGYTAAISFGIVMPFAVIISRCFRVRHVTAASRNLHAAAGGSEPGTGVPWSRCTPPRPPRVPTTASVLWRHKSQIRILDVDLLALHVVQEYAPAWIYLHAPLGLAAFIGGVIGVAFGGKLPSDDLPQTLYEAHKVPLVRMLQLPSFVGCGEPQQTPPGTIGAYL